MRVVAGKARGRSLQAPPGRGTRPTADRVREAAFSALSSLWGVEEAIVVDLYAGSGALGIEALSRGAAGATFVEQDRVAASVIRTNLTVLGLDGPGVSVMVSDAMAVAGSRGVVSSADLVFADPPYRFERWPELLGRLASGGFRGLVVAETGSPLTAPVGWDVVRDKTYGSTVVTMLSAVSAPSEGGPIQGGIPR